MGVRAGACVSVCVRARVRARAHVCARVHARACVHTHTHTHTHLCLITSPFNTLTRLKVLHISYCQKLLCEELK